MSHKILLTGLKSEEKNPPPPHKHSHKKNKNQFSKEDKNEHYQSLFLRICELEE
jgi:hypothetical protein